MDYKNKRKIAIVGVLIFALLAGAYTYGKFKEVGAKKIFAAVQNGTLIPDATGTVVLPSNLNYVTVDGRAYVTRKGDLLMVLLPTWEGRDSNLRGYLLCSRPLTSADMHKDEYEEKYDAINIFTPGPQYESLPTQVEVILERKLNTSTYYVSRSLD